MVNNKRKFRIGQEVIIVRNLGSRRGHQSEYCYEVYGVYEVPLGTRATISDIEDRWSIYLKLGGNKFRNYEEFHVHPGEIKIDEISEEKRQKKFGSLLEKALLSKPTAEDEKTNERRAFRPKFNAKDEFPVWVREQFPDLKRYAKGWKEYKELTERIGEVRIAAEEAWKKVEDIAYYPHLCHKSFLRPRFNSFNNSQPKEYANALERLVRVLEISVTEGFPYNGKVKNL